MNFNSKEKELIRSIYLCTSLTEAQVEECFHGLSVTYTEALILKKPIIVPFVGEFRARLNSQKETADGIQNDVSLFSSPSPLFKSIVGQVSREEASGSVLKTSSLKWSIEKLTQALGRNINLHDM